MADYWKSNPRKYCECCKCWFADDKPSRDFHEGGRRHQANAKKQLEDARARSLKNSKEQLNLEKTLRAIEHAAFDSYQQDMAGVTKKAKLPRPGMEQLTQTQQFLAAEQQTLEREREKEKIMAMAQERMQEIQTKAATEAAQKAYSAIVDVSEWEQCYSPEGYVYYYNSKTGVSQWEIPENYQQSSGPAPEENKPRASTEPPSPTASESTSSETPKRTAEQAGLVEDEKVHHQPKRVPYGGAWTTVTVYEKEETEPQGTGDRQEDEGQEQQQSKKQEIQFEEKKLTGGLMGDEGKLGGDFKGFTFKKRTNKGTTKLRGRTSDF